MQLYHIIRGFRLIGCWDEKHLGGIMYRPYKS